jgi:diacylglycerol kinase (ATP)
MPDVVQIVVTPGSGDGRARATARRLQKALVRRGYTPHTQTFADLEHLLEWSATCEADYSHLVAVGGDATLSAAAAAAVRLSIPFLPVPTGFGNMFARAFGFGDQTRRVIEHFERGQVRRVDIGVYPGERIFLSHRSYGLLEDIQRAVERGRAQPKSRVLRHLAYYVTAQRHILIGPLPSIRVEVDGTLLAEEAALVTVANVETYSGFLNLTPSASPIDGLFDVFVIPRTTKIRAWARIFRILLGLPRRWDGVVLSRGRSVRVTADGRAPEILEVRRRALPLLVLPESLESLKIRQAEAEVATALEGGGLAAPPLVTEPRAAELRLPS